MLSVRGKSKKTHFTPHPRTILPQTTSQVYRPLRRRIAQWAASAMPVPTVGPRKMANQPSWGINQPAINASGRATNAATR